MPSEEETSEAVSGGEKAMSWTSKRVDSTENLLMGLKP
jgi:hypothetical protein